MSSNANSVVIVGNLTRDPETKSFESGTSVTEFGIANNRSVKKNDEWEEVASFFEVKVWGTTGENCARKLRKGSFVTLLGRLDQERWQTAEGENRSKVVIVAQTVEGADFFVKGENPQQRQEQNVLAGVGAAQTSDFAPTGVDDDIPF